MAKSRGKLQLNTVAVDLGCTSCRKPKLSFIFHPKPKLETTNCRKARHLARSSSTSWDWNDVASSTSPPFSGPVDSHSFFSESETDTKNSLTFQGLGRIGGKSVAIEIDSDDPYLDFRQSMLQMIIENEIYSKDDLCNLLKCFLQLNSPSNHGIIVRAFTETWNSLFSVRSAAPFPPAKNQYFNYNYRAF